MINIGCMFDNYNDLEFETLCFYAKSYGIRIFSFTPEDIDWQKQVIKGTQVIEGKSEKGEFTFPDAVYNRCYSDRLEIINKLEGFIGKNKIFNHMNWLDKWNVYQCLVNTELKGIMPYTGIYNKSDLMYELNKYKALFIKPSKGNWGNGVYKLELQRDGGMIIYDKTSKDIFTPYESEKFINKVSELTKGREYLIQEEIPMIKLDDKFFDVRFMLQKNIDGLWNATASCCHIAESNSIVTNVCSKICRVEVVLYSLGFEISIMDKMAEASMKIAKKLEENLCFLGEISMDLGVDVIGNHWLIEVNGKPAKEMFRYMYNQDLMDKIYRMPIEFAYHLAQK